jgi:drug/metabolite transporter (DMT)-like permease
MAANANGLGGLGDVRAWAVRLWRGEEPLARAFWMWAVALGAILNVAGTFLVYAVLQLHAPTFVVVLAYVSPIPYNLFAFVGVWRSAARYTGPTRIADLARAALVAWTVAECAL